MPEFWEYPHRHDYPYYWFISDPKSKQDEVKGTKLKKISKNSNFELFQKNFTRGTPFEVAW